MMRKSEYICSRLRWLKKQRRFLNHLPSEYIRVQCKHTFKLSRQVRPKRRISLWRARILVDGHRSWHNKDVL